MVERKRVYFKDPKTKTWHFIGEYNYLSRARQEAKWIKNRGLSVKIVSKSRKFKL